MINCPRTTITLITNYAAMDRLSDNEQRQLLRRRVATYVTLIVSIMLTAVASLLESGYICNPYHTSALTGEAWVIELLSGHPERM